MNSTAVAVNTYAHNGHSRSVTIPISIPDLSDVRNLAARLHAAGQSYQDFVWGWEVTYEPELSEEESAAIMVTEKGPEEA